MLGRFFFLVALVIYFLLMWGFMGGAIALFGALVLRVFGVGGVGVVLLVSAVLAFFLSALLLRALRRRV